MGGSSGSSDNVAKAAAETPNGFNGAVGSSDDAATKRVDSVQLSTQILDVEQRPVELLAIPVSWAA